MIDPLELHAWADGEVATERAESVRRELAESAAARLELESIVALKRFLRERATPLECHASWQACVARITEMDRTRRVERLAQGRFAWGLSGVLFVAILAAGIFHRTDPSHVTSADLARVMGTFTHVHRSATSKETDDVINLLFKQGNISLDPHRLDVLGTEYSQVDGHVATRYLLRDPSGLMNLVIVPNVFQIDENGQLPPNQASRRLVLNNLNCVAWNTARGTLMLAGARSFEELAAVASGLH